MRSFVTSRKRPLSSRESEPMAKETLDALAFEELVRQPASGFSHVLLEPTVTVSLLPIHIHSITVILFISCKYRILCSWFQLLNRAGIYGNSHVLIV